LIELIEWFIIIIITVLHFPRSGEPHSIGESLDRVII